MTVWAKVSILGFVGLLWAAGCATESNITASPLSRVEQAPRMIDLDKAVHFTSPDGAPVVVPPGIYDVSAAGATALTLTPGGGGTAVTIAAMPSPQTYLVEQTEAIAIALPGEEEDMHHVLFAHADGAALEAAGSYSGTHTRALNVFLPAIKAITTAQTKVLSSSLKSQVTSPPNLGGAPPVLDSPLSITPGLNVTAYQQCTDLPGYVSSILKMVQMSQRPGERPVVAAEESMRPRIILIDTYVAPAQPRPGPTYPNEPFNRIVPKSPYRCMFGSVTVSGRNLKAGQKVRLSMEVMDLAKRRLMVITDTYELPVSTSGAVTFGKVVVASIPLFNVPASQSETGYITEVIKKVAPTGSLVKIEASVAGGAPAKRDCLWKPTKDGWGQGTLVCK